MVEGKSDKNERVGATDAEPMLLTGACGFIGSTFLRQLAYRNVPIMDALTYAGDSKRLAGIQHELIVVDLADRERVAEHVRRIRPSLIVHFAAESHVTRSENADALFHHTNVEGTRVLLDALCEVEPTLVIHISTDEVYGPCLDTPFREDQKEPGEGLATSPYARSKALADDLACSYMDRLPLIVVRPTNCFGPWQHPEKAFPRWIARALRGEQLPIWGDGGYVRDWLPVGDLCRALQIIIERGEPGSIYNVGPERTPEITNRELASWLLDYLDLPQDRMVFTAYDRPDHDRRYAVDSSRVRALGWEPSPNVWERFAETVEWYKAHRSWWEKHFEAADAIYADRAELAGVKE